MIGTSLSFCIKGILEGKVALDQVDYIIARTKCRSEGDWESLIKSYSTSYWEKDPDKARKILQRLLSEGKIIQPCLSDNPIPIGCTPWVVSVDDIVWSD